jgi:hypothetical protein
MEDAVILGRASGGGRAGGTGSIDRDGGGGRVRAGNAGLNGRATGGRAGSDPEWKARMDEVGNAFQVHYHSGWAYMAGYAQHLF